MKTSTHFSSFEGGERLPELPEVETVRRGLEQAMLGRRITEVILRRENLRFPFPDEFASRVSGRRIDSIRRRAKYLLLDLDDGQIILSHLGMSGRYTLFDSERVKQFEATKNEASRFSGDRTFKMLKIKGSFKDVDPDDERTWKTADIDQFRYEGKDGIIKVKDIGDKGSLGSLYDWDNIDRLDEFVFRGDDIIYGPKIKRNYPKLYGFSGDDTFYLHGDELAEGGKGKDRFIVTKFAAKNRLKGNSSIFIDANSSQGDVVEVFGRESDFTAKVERGSVFYEGKYGNDLFIDFTKQQPVFADFLTG